ncbi:DUF4230 domain-containing protein [Sphingomonas sp. C3-2]|uniref:DUF4230 domain-containing protein n=1 Tax=Sphingomonas sp. C3-2 TaxID=3062169 RepID=UPI00294B1F14|nr:DUF4230 domain-containing protein [Sphingomonas sp. C3-2]WOK37351.1 DUF4230 domain-containing protein [Sphingomonas sp. C3-2]
MKPLGKWLIAIAFAIALGLGALLLVQRTAENRWQGSLETIAASSLQGLREQNRLSAFAARFVAVVTSEQNRFGLSAKKTLIMPGLVRYEVDLSKLADKDLRWDEATKTLSITLPPVEISGPEVDMTAIREYDGGGILLALTDAEKTLDAANRKAGQVELVRQAREDVPMKLAREATRRAIANSFSMPLKAAGVEANVVARFSDESGG